MSKREERIAELVDDHLGLFSELNVLDYDSILLQVDREIMESQKGKEEEMIFYIRYSKQAYYVQGKWGVDDIMVGNYGDGFSWEFRIVSVDLGRWENAIQVRIFEDAVKSLKDKRIVKSLIELEGLKTLDEVEEILRNNNIKEKNG